MQMMLGLSTSEVETGEGFVVGAGEGEGFQFVGGLCL